MKRATLVIICALLCDVCYAQFTGPAFFNTAPNSQLGGVTNNLTITNTANGFVVSGQVIINVTGPASGTLAHWVVDRPLDPTYNANNIFTTTILDGFSAPPTGIVGNTNGVVESIFTDYLGTTTSLSSVPMTLIAGIDNPPWITLSSTSALFNHTGSAGQFLRQWFWLDGDYIAGPGGNWIVDVPVSTFILPEPSSMTMLVIAGVCLGAWRLRRRAH